MMHNLAVYNPQTHKFDVPIRYLTQTIPSKTRCFIDQSNKLWAVTPLSLRRYNSSTLALEDSIPMQGVFPHPLLHAHQRNPMAGGKPPDNIVRHTYAQIQGTPKPFGAIRFSACQRQLHPPLRQQQPAAEYRPTRNVSLQLRGRIRDTSERKRFSLRSASLQDKHHVYRLQKNLWIGSVDQGYVCVTTIKNVSTPIIISAHT